MIYTVVGGGIGILFNFILSLMGLTMVGIIVILSLALLGFLIGTLKVPNTEKFEFARKTGGENLDDIIKRAIKFKTKGKRIYIYKEEKRDGQ